MSLRRRLELQQLPTRTVVLAPVVAGADPDEIVVRALPGDEWEALELLHPPLPEQRAQGWQWNVVTFRAPLLAACVVAPDDEQPLTEHDWAQLLLRMPIGDRDRLYNAAVEVNENLWPGADQGKG